MWTRIMMRLKEKYTKEVIPEMMAKFGYKNAMAVPKIEKVVVNTGFGKLISGKTSEEQKKIYQAILDDLSLICGQRPEITVAKKSISGIPDTAVGNHPQLRIDLFLVLLGDDPFVIPFRHQHTRLHIVP